MCKHCILKIQSHIGHFGLCYILISTLALSYPDTHVWLRYILILNHIKPFLLQHAAQTFVFADCTFTCSHLQFTSMAHISSVHVYVGSNWLYLEDGPEYQELALTPLNTSIFSLGHRSLPAKIITNLAVIFSYYDSVKDSKQPVKLCIKDKLV